MSTKRARAEERAIQRRRPGRAGAPRKVHGSPGSARQLSPFTPRDRKRTLLARLKMAEETLDAIRSGEVDAVMVSGRRGVHAVTLAGGEPAYRILVEAMSEGAATVSRDGAVLYCNRRFADLLGRPAGKVVGLAVQSLVAEAERRRMETLLAEAQKRVAKGEFELRRRDRSLVPVNVSLNRFRGHEGHTLGMVVTDLSRQKRQRAAEINQAKTMHRLLLERAFSAQEEERRRIARELHDEAGQLLASLLVGLRTLEDSAKVADAKAQGQRLRKITARAIEEVGRLARGLHPTVLEDHGLGVALSRYVAEYSEAHKIAVHLSLRGLDSSNLPQEVQIGLYRVLQECLTNVARHSGASNVRIAFAHSATALKVAVLDDGCGFDAGAVIASSRRLGIHSMRERVAMLGGTISFTSPGKGTSVLLQVPLRGGGRNRQWRRERTRLES